ncbi:signal recognition particle-docking protein FtsY [Christensenellaceae bacterium OttesenSCG-928-M15]|nr:signal recognition particle-docking protein FtsY [Christensenellaceae bacterium OttesenSCG-928-M15]
MEKKTGLFQKLKQGLSKTRSGILANVFSGRDRIDEELYEELEEALIVADVGMDLTERLLDELRAKVKADRLSAAEEARTALIEIVGAHMKPKEAFLPDSGNAVLLIVGVNGVGKTTSIGKLASLYKQQGKKPMLAAADTFRAAAAEQLGVWAERADVPMVRHGEGADPAAVVYDAIASFKSKGCDILICDTAGRLHNKKNLMHELEKIRRVIDRELPDATCRVLLVLDATTGQNAIIQAKAFSEATGLTDVVLTKLDGTAKGGMVIAIQDELNIPVRFIGVGESIDDLQPFDAEAFAKALFE